MEILRKMNVSLNFLVAGMLSLGILIAVSGYEIASCFSSTEVLW